MLKIIEQIVGVAEAVVVVVGVALLLLAFIWRPLKKLSRRFVHREGLWS